MRTYILLVILLLWGAPIALAQSPNISYSQGSKDAMEIGIHAGHFFADGNIDFTPGYAGGIHFRKSLDYVFSLRANLMYGQATGEDPGNVRSFENTWLSGSIQAIVSLNNLKWTMKERKTNFFAFAGVGFNSFEVELIEMDVMTDKVDSEVSAQIDLGAGISFKISDKINIGIEHQAMWVPGERSDLLDGVNTINNPSRERTTFRDVANYTSVRINFNLSKKEERTEPLYWLNPMESVLSDVQLLKDTRVRLNDEDEDGVIDMLDEEEETPEGAPVDAKGVAIDSDNDGLKDYEDEEPFSAPGVEVNDKGVAQTPDVMAEVEKLVDERLKEFQPAVSEPKSAGISTWFLPTIYFDNNQANIKAQDYGTLANLADVMNANSDLRFVVSGHTDEVGSPDFNNQLSWQRANAVISHLVETHGIDRQRLVLEWKGEAQNLAPGVFEANRRVQFRVAKDEQDMAAPDSGN